MKFQEDSRSQRFQRSSHKSCVIRLHNPLWPRGEKTQNIKPNDPCQVESPLEFLGFLRQNKEHIHHTFIRQLASHQETCDWGRISSSYCSIKYKVKSIPIGLFGPRFSKSFRVPLFSLFPNFEGDMPSISYLFMATLLNFHKWMKHNIRHLSWRIIRRLTIIRLFSGSDQQAGL